MIFNENSYLMNLIRDQSVVTEILPVQCNQSNLMKGFCVLNEQWAPKWILCYRYAWLQNAILTTSLKVHPHENNVNL